MGHENIRVSRVGGVNCLVSKAGSRSVVEGGSLLAGENFEVEIWSWGRILIVVRGSATVAAFVEFYSRGCKISGSAGGFAVLLMINFAVQGSMVNKVLVLRPNALSPRLASTHPNSILAHHEGCWSDGWILLLLGR